MKKQHPLITDLFNVLLSCNYEGSIINKVSQDTHLIEAELTLPYHREISDFEELLPNIKQEFNCTDAKITKRLGKNITVLFGKRNLNDINFNETYLHPNTLQIELPSSYGSSILDFADGASCHLLNGGTTRMGKTKFLLYLSTVLYVQTKGNIELYITSTKAKDFFMFRGLANISKTQEDFNDVLDILIEEYQKRDKLLYSPALEKSTDAKDVIEHYPHMAHHFKPIFLLVDEYARFSDNKEIQKKVIELTETAGYVNIHLIITTQRPDARTVLPPRIKGNLLARICFTTADEANSVIILDRSGAESLGRIAGRAILSDSEYNIVQVPLITTDQVLEQLKPFRGNHHATINQNPKGTTNTELSSKIQDMFKESTSQIMFSEQHEPHQRMQSNHETVNNGWNRLASPTIKGKDVPVHPKS
jgi:S-DNA-T family DNA segregation ATPase FtsK/SpoIIIE